MKTCKSPLLVLMGNILLVTYFTHLRIGLRHQVELVREKSEALRQSNYESRRLLSSTSSDIVNTLKSNFLRLKKLTEYTKSWQVRIKGIPEEYGEDLERKVVDFIESMGIKMSAADINRVNRVATPKKKLTTLNRVVVVELASTKLKQEILHKASTSLVNTDYAIQDDVTNHMMPEGFLPVQDTNFPEGCGYISSVSQPTTKSQTKKFFGAWLQDPIPSFDRKKDNLVWILPQFYENNVVEEYGSILELTRKKKRTTYKLPYEWAGTGHVVYNKTLYFIPFNSSKIVRYDFATKSVLKERKIPVALSGNNAPYQWAGSTDIDLSTDVYGLWAIYATYDNTLDIVISRVDPVSLQVIQTWRTNWRKQWSGNAFMMCGVLYVLKKYDEHDTALSYMYDTRLRRYKRVNIPFSNKYEWNSMLEYNFRQKKIYAWDRGYLVTYDVTLSEKMPE